MYLSYRQTIAAYPNGGGAYTVASENLGATPAVGAFLTFTMSQASMVMHWRRHGGRGATRALVINAVGAVATGATLVVIVASKFLAGAWVTVIIVPALVLVFQRIRDHEESIDRATDVDGPVQLDAPPPPIVVVPIKRLNRVARKALRLAVSISPDVQRRESIRCTSRSE